MADDRTLETEVVVVGAGLAGLTAARELTAAGRDVVVLEARDRVGGRLLNHDIGNGKVVEVGGQWIGPTQNRIADLARELGVDTFHTYDEGENLLEFRGRLKRYTGTIPRLGLVTLLDYAQAQLRLDRMARRVPLDAPWEAPNAARLDSQTAASWMRRNLLTKAARDFFELAVEAVWAAQPEDISLLHLLFYTHSGGGLDRLVDTDGGAQQDRFVGGSQRVPIAMAGELGERVVLGAPVRAIEHSADAVRVVADGIVATGRRVIVAIPPTLTARIAYDPPLPGHRDQLTQRMPQGTVAKCMAIYDRPFWRAAGAHRTGRERQRSGEGDVRQLAALGRARRAARVPRRAPRARARPDGAGRRRELVLDCFARSSASARRPNDYVEKLWAEEEWTRGCYGCYMPTGGWTGFGDGAAGADRPDPLGGRGDRHGVERIHGRRRAVWTSGGDRSARRPRRHPRRAHSGDHRVLGLRRDGALFRHPQAPRRCARPAGRRARRGRLAK